MKVAFVADSVGAEASGVSYVVKGLSASVATFGIDVDVLNTGTIVSSIPKVRCINCQVSFGKVPILNRLRMSPPLRSLLRASEYRLVHTHGLWTMPGIYAGKVARQRGLPHVVTTHGMLSSDALRISPHVKKAFWSTLQRSVLASAKCIHVTSEGEHDDIRRAGLRTPIALIPNGVGLGTSVRRAKSHSNRTMLYLGRIHPIKNLEGLLQAWALVESKHPDWNLSIVGPGTDAYISNLRMQASALGARRVQFKGPVYGAEKRRILRRADAYVLPSKSENFGLTVAEALSEGTPAVSTIGAPWEGLATHRCGYWVNVDAGSLASGLTLMMENSPAELTAMGERGRLWIKSEFGWNAVGRAMSELYTFLVDGGEAPSCLRFD